MKNLGLSNKAQAAAVGISVGILGVGTYIATSPTPTPTPQPKSTPSPQPTPAPTVSNLAILTINTNGFGSTDQQTQTVTKGTFVATTATPNAGYKFDHWQTSWATNIPDNPLALIVNTDQTITAIFVQAVNTSTPTS